MSISVVWILSAPYQANNRWGVTCRRGYKTTWLLLLLLLFDRITTRLPTLIASTTADDMSTTTKTMGWVTIQPDFCDILAELKQSKTARESLWISCYNKGAFDASRSVQLVICRHRERRVGPRDSQPGVVF